MADETKPIEQEDIASLGTPPEPERQAEMPEPEPESPRKRKHPASLVRLAIRYGATHEAIESSTTGDLIEWIEQQELIRMHEQEKRSRPRDEPKPAPVGDEIDWGTDSLGNPLKEADIEPGLAKLIKAQNKRLRQLEEARKEDAIRASRQNDAIIDDAFANLPAKYHKLFGDGTIDECDAAQKKRRYAALMGAKINFNSLPSAAILSKKLQQEADAIFGVASEDEQNGRPTAEQYRNGVLARATHRTPGKEKSPQAAIRAVAEKQRAMGIDVGVLDDGDLKNDFPD